MATSLGPTVANRAKQKGTSMETAVVNYLAERGIDARRKVLAGANDEGDIDVGPPGRGNGLTLEVKNCRTYAFGAWVDEAQVEATNAGRTCFVVAKRNGKGDPGEAFVVLKLSQLADLLVTHPSLFGSGQ